MLLAGQYLRLRGRPPLRHKREGGRTLRKFSRVLFESIDFRSVGSTDI
jgi:hypothetical protein